MYRLCNTRCLWLLGVFQHMSLALCGPAALKRSWAAVVTWMCVLGLTPTAKGADKEFLQIPVDLSGYSRESAVDVRQLGKQLLVRWSMDQSERGHLTLNLDPGQPLIARLGLSTAASQSSTTLLENVDPVIVITVGSRQGLRTDGWVAFFDRVPRRPYTTHLARLTLNQVRVFSKGLRTTIALERLTAGPFGGELLFTVYPNGRLVHVEAVMHTSEDRRAIVYDAGLVAAKPSWRRIAWMDTQGNIQGADTDPVAPARAIAVRHRTIVAETAAGSVAVFPPPHQFFYPLDISYNLKFVWYGKGFRQVSDRFGLGIRQHLEGDGRFVPWFNAPPGTRQRLGMFFLLSSGQAQDALDQVLRYTHGDRFRALPGHLTFSSHYHFAHTVNAMRRRAGAVPETPEFVRILKDMGVNIVHLAEFHGDGDSRDPGPKRLPQLEMMFKECARLSDDDFLLLPGEEPNVHLGGHWMNLFPKPVFWIMSRTGQEQFAQPHPRFGTVYRVRSAHDILRLLREEQGLAWTAHARIKSSHGYPDRHRHSDFYLSDRWLGAAWKAMPADLSRPRLGERVLDLLDDMANWGQKKYVMGEVDVFKIDSTHELYGHMNINYLRLSELPKFSHGWQPVLDSLGAGEFFVTTGEILLPRFTVDGKQSGETLKLPEDQRPEVSVTFDWTFPLRFAELVSGDGTNVFRERIDLDDTKPFGQRTLTLRPNLKGRKWVRLAIWDVAANGAFTQPVWLE